MMRKRHGGAALGVVLLLLLGLALLALAGSAAAIAALALAGLDEQHSLAFEAAEAGITRALRVLSNGGTLPAEPLTVAPWPELESDVTMRVAIREHDPTSAGLPVGFSLGNGAAYWGTRRITIISDGRAGRGAAVRLEQDVVVRAGSDRSSQP